MKEKKTYVENKDNIVQARVETKEVFFSDDPRDMGYMAENVPCQDACPADTNIPGYIRCIAEKRYGRAYELNRMYNILPGVLGRICSRPCEKECRHGEADLGQPVNICHLKRSAADLKSKWHRIKENLYTPTGKHVAIIGAGPAGLAAAHELSTLGHRATIYEAMEKPGGMLMYGIPEFRLPRDILNLEINNILRLGVDLVTGVRIGDTLSIQSLLKQHDGVIIATGCQESFSLKAEGEDLDGVFSGLDFMYQVNCNEKVVVGDKVIVIGGGYTAVDCARIAVRLGASQVSINLRKTEEFMRIDDHEKKETRQENIRIYSLVQPLKINGVSGKISSVTFKRTRLQYMNTPPFRKAVPIENSQFTVSADTVILAIGQVPETNFLDKKIKRDGRRIKTPPQSTATSVKGLFAAGDCVTGTTNVITAIANGRRAASDTDEFLINRKRKHTLARFEPAGLSDRPRSYDFIPQVPMPTVDTKNRFKAKVREVERGYDADAADQEAKRCYLCNLKFEIHVDRCIYCSACIDVAPRDCIKMIENVDMQSDGSFGDYKETADWKNVAAIAIDNKRCIRCGQCLKVCPMQCISVTKVELVELYQEG